MLLLIFKLFIVLFTNESSAIDLPNSPCPDIFKYESSPVHGIMTFKNDLSGSYKVELNMSITSYSNQNIGIKRITSSGNVQLGCDISYYVTFPSSDRVPEVSSVVFNGQLFCTMQSGQKFGVTFLNAYDFFFVTMTVHQPPYPMIAHQSKSTTIPYKRPTFLDFTLPYGSFEKTVPSVQKTVPSVLFPTIPPRTTKSSTTPLTTTPVAVIEHRHREQLECGLAEDTQALVVHGSPTSEGQYPWLVAMFHLEDSGEYKFKCGANLISQWHVITAAHCVRKEKLVNIPNENIILVLGKHNIKSWAVRSEIRDIKEIYVHPDYSKPSDADISILHMYKPVEFTDKIRPVCLWSEESETIVGSNGTVVGWGRDEFFNEYVPEPREVSMPVVSQEDCLRSDERFIKLTSNRTFCAGARKGSGACTGDSGGGFILNRKGRWTLRGLVSSALVDSSSRSCDVNNYMVFSDVVKFKTWIERVMAK